MSQKLGAVERGAEDRLGTRSEELRGQHVGELVVHAVHRVAHGHGREGVPEHCRTGLIEREQKSTMRETSRELRTAKPGKFVRIGGQEPALHRSQGSGGLASWLISSRRRRTIARQAVNKLLP